MDLRGSASKLLTFEKLTQLSCRNFAPPASGSFSCVEPCGARVAAIALTLRLRNSHWVGNEQGDGCLNK